MFAGAATGSTLWPMKVIRRLQFEHYWFVGMLPLMILPWLVVVLTIPDPWAGFQEVGWRPLLIANSLAVGWGIANIMGGLCVVRIGLALTGAIVTGFGVSVAVTVPLVLKGTGLFADSPDLFSLPGLIVIGAVVLLLTGVVFSAMAGFGREQAQKSMTLPAHIPAGSFVVGLMMAAVAGVLSAGPALAFVYGNGPIVAAMRVHGAGEVSANLAVWAGGFFGGALVNILYPACLMLKHRSWAMIPKHYGESLLATLIGAQLIIGFGFQGLGMVAFGGLGASVGTGIQQSVQIVSAQVVGFAGGEWHGVFGRPRQYLFVAIGMLLVAVVAMALANTLSS
jgi:hypothetical protein